MIPLHSGSFELDSGELELAAKATLLLVGIELEGRRCTLPDATAFSLGAPDWIVRVTLSPEVRIRVLSAESGAELPHAELRALPSRWLAQRPPPCPGCPRSSTELDLPYPPPRAFSDDALLASGPSPLSVAWGGDALTCWIGAPGFAWRSFVAEPDATEHRILLERGAGLRVRVEGWSASGLEIRLRELTRSPERQPLFLEDVLGSAERKWEALPAGEFEISLRHSGRLLAETRLELEPGGEHELVLSRNSLSARGRVLCRLTPGEGAQTPTRVSLERIAADGSLELHREWSGEQLERHASPDEVLLVAPECSLPRGRYLVSAAPSTAGRIVELDGDAQELVLGIPPTFPFQVLFLDETSGLGVDPEWVAVAARPEGTGSSDPDLLLHRCHLHLRQPGSLVELELPAGATGLAVHARGFGITHHHLELSDPSVAVEIPLKRLAQIEIQVEEPELLRALSGSWITRVEVLDALGAPLPVQGRATRRSVRGGAPGQTGILLVDHRGSGRVRIPLDAAGAAFEEREIELDLVRPVTLVLGRER